MGAFRDFVTGNCLIERGRKVLFAGESRSFPSDNEVHQEKKRRAERDGKKGEGNLKPSIIQREERSHFLQEDGGRNKHTQRETCQN